MMDGGHSTPPDADLSSAFAFIERELRENADSRRRLEIDPRAVLEEWGIGIPPAMELHVVANTGDTYHVIMPLDPNATLADEALSVVYGGTGSAGTATFSPSPGDNSGTAWMSMASFPSCSLTPVSD